MRCTCGYLYENRLPAKQREFASYVVVDDKDYRKFLRSEIKAVNAPTEKAKLAALWKSSTYIGMLRICPKCSKLLFMHPDAKTIEIYAKEATVDDPAGNRVICPKCVKRNMTKITKHNVRRKSPTRTKNKR